MKGKVSLDRASIIEALSHLHVIVPSLDRIGYAEAEMKKDEAHRVLSDFMDDWSVAARLARVRRLLSEALDYDEEERLFGDVETWSLGARKPKKRWKK
jgi:hypothetical protein